MKLFPSRTREATEQQVIATGAAGVLVDPIDGDIGYRNAGERPGEIPAWTRRKARAYSVAGYRANPLARAIIDTYVAFGVGDSGVSLQSSSPEVRAVADRFWHDPANNLGGRQEIMFRSHLLQGESLYEMMVGQLTGVTRYSPIDTNRIMRVDLLRGNVMWPESVALNDGTGGEVPLSIARIDEINELRTGDALFWASFKALETDTRGDPFLSPVLDWLTSYDQVLSNLIDRTALARYLVWDVTVDGDETAIEKFVSERGGRHAPRSGTIEVHNKGIEWAPKTAQTGSYEDANTGKSVMTNIAAGTGLSKVWLAEPEDANRATALTMAEPVRRRIGSVQNVWLGYMTEMVRYAIDQAVAAGRLPALIDVPGEGNVTHLMTAAETVKITGPQIAAADAKVTADVLHRLSLGLEKLIQHDVLSKEAARVAGRKAWEEFMGIPYTPELDAEDADTDDIATAVEDAGGGNPPPLLAAV